MEPEKKTISMIASTSPTPRTPRTPRGTVLQSRDKIMHSMVSVLKTDFNTAEFSEKHILKYQPDKLFSHGFINPRGSVLTVGMCVRTLIMLGAGTFAAVPKFSCDPAAKKLAWSFCFPILTGAEGLIFASLVAFLLGLFISTTFSRWWSSREKLSAIMNHTSLETILLTNFVAADEPSQAASNTIIRWMHLAHSLVYKHANRDTDYSTLPADLVTKEEVEKLLTYGNPPVMVYGWCMKAVKDLIMQNKIGHTTIFAPTVNSILCCINAAQELFSFLDTQMPYAYLHLLSIVTKIHLVFVIFYAGGIISAGIQMENWSRIIFGYTVIAANNVIYEGLLHIHSMLSNPLGNDTGDFPKHVYLSNTRALCNSLQVL